MYDQLTKHTSYHQLIATFQQAEAVVRASFAQIVAAEDTLGIIFTMGETGSGKSIHVAPRLGDIDFRNPDKTIQQMSRQAWACIVERLELRRMLSVERYEALQKRLRDEKTPLPPITEENVRAFVAQYVGSFDAMIEEAVKEIFEWLRPSRRTTAGKLKTNTQLEIGPKVVIGGLVQAQDRWGWRPSVTKYVGQRLIALENVFHGIRGEGTTARYNQSELEIAIDASMPTEGKGETDLFRFHVFRNGNGHIWFKDLEALKRLNAMAGGMRLRPGAPPAP